MNAKRFALVPFQFEAKCLQDLYIAVSIRTEVIAIKLSDQKSGEFKSDAVSVSAS